MQTICVLSPFLKDFVAHLHECPRLLAELVVVLELNSDGLVTVQACELHVCGVAHEEGAEEVCRSDT